MGKKEQINFILEYQSISNYLCYSFDPDRDRSITDWTINNQYLLHISWIENVFKLILIYSLEMLIYNTLNNVTIYHSFYKS